MPCFILETRFDKQWLFAQELINFKIGKDWIIAAGFIQNVLWLYNTLQINHNSLDY